MWKATINSARSNAAHEVEVSVTYENGVSDPINEVLRTTVPSSIERLIKNKLNQLEDVDSYLATATTGLVTFTDSPEDDYNAKKAALFQAKQDLDLGLIAQEDFDSVLSDVKSVKATVDTIEASVSVTAA
jgi:hypothetical protein